VEMVKTYLDIEKIRFGERLQFTVMVDNDLENHKIPLFLIQPLVENAVKHGISRNEGIGKIELQIVKEQNEMKISVRDNGLIFLKVY
jgi:sensor histidine kinase YesM